LATPPEVSTNCVPIWRRIFSTPGSGKKLNKNNCGKKNSKRTDVNLIG
jgi:hypothetical protein